MTDGCFRRSGSALVDDEVLACPRETGLLSLLDVLVLVAGLTATPVCDCRAGSAVSGLPLKD